MAVDLPTTRETPSASISTVGAVGLSKSSTGIRTRAKTIGGSSGASVVPGVTVRTASVPVTSRT